MFEPERIELQNGAVLDVINTGDQDLSRLDIGFEGGRCDGQSGFVGEMAVAMLREGTTSRDSRQIAELLDYNGSWMAGDVSAHNTLTSIYSLNRSFADILPVVCDIVENPVFPEQTLDLLKKQAVSRLRVNRRKVAVEASNHFLKAFFGEKHNMGMVPEERLVEAVTTDMLKSFHREWYTLPNMHIILSGRVTDRMIADADNTLGRLRLNPGVAKTSRTDRPTVDWTVDRIDVEMEDALQSAIYMALPANVRSHPDYIPLRILVTALGGYFGSRLMANIREDKGYTYGIYSALYGYRDCSFIAVSSQCDNRYTEAVIDEVRKEIRKLRDERIGEEELQLVKNHMKSDLLQTLETPFSIADYQWVIHNNRLTADYYNNQLRTIESITPERLREMAERYFDVDKALTVVVGHNK